MFNDTALLVKLYWTIDRRGDSRQSRIVRLISLIIIAGVVVLLSFGVGVGAGALVTNPALPGMYMTKPPASQGVSLSHGCAGYLRNPRTRDDCWNATCRLLGKG